MGMATASLVMGWDAPRQPPGWGDAAEPLLSLQAEWTAASASISFFESFCSTSQRAFNASRETCAVTLTSHEPRSQHWAVRAVVHSEYGPTIPPGAGQDGTSIGRPWRGDAA